MSKVKALKTIKLEKKDPAAHFKRLLNNGKVMVKIFEAEDGRVLLEGFFHDEMLEQVLGKGKMYKVFEYVIVDGVTHAKKVLEHMKGQGIMMEP